jgi:hypothetical protein
MRFIIPNIAPKRTEFLLLCDYRTSKSTMMHWHSAGQGLVVGLLPGVRLEQSLPLWKELHAAVYRIYNQNNAMNPREELLEKFETFQNMLWPNSTVCVTNSYAIQL